MAIDAIFVDVKSIVYYIDTLTIILLPTQEFKSLQIQKVYPSKNLVDKNF